MTNVKEYLNSAIKNLESGKLSSIEKVFIESIKNYSEKELRMLNSNQFDLLKDISNK